MDNDNLGFLRSCEHKNAHLKGKDSYLENSKLILTSVRGVLNLIGDETKIVLRDKTNNKMHWTEVIEFDNKYEVTEEYLSKQVIEIVPEVFDFGYESAIGIYF